MSFLGNKLSTNTKSESSKTLIWIRVQVPVEGMEPWLTPTDGVGSREMETIGWFLFGDSKYKCLGEVHKLNVSIFLVRWAISDLSR